MLEIKKEGHADDRVATEGPQRTTHASLPLEVGGEPALIVAGLFRSAPADQPYELIKLSDLEEIDKQQDDDD